jgi:hypothetical protein
MARVQLRVTEWNAERLLGRSTQILEEFAPIIAEEARRQLGLVQYKWEQGTLRFQSIGGLGKKPKSGVGVYVAPGLRDILDTGELRNSQQAPQIQNNQLSIEWTAPYSGVVLRGGDYGSYTTPTGERVKVGERPGRDWITPALQAQPVLPFFVGRWRALAGR